MSDKGCVRVKGARCVRPKVRKREDEGREWEGEGEGEGERTRR